MSVPIVTGTNYNQEIQTSNRSVTQNARSITETTSESTTVRSGGSRTYIVPPSSTTNAISPSHEVRAAVPSLSASATPTIQSAAPTRQLASPEEIAQRYTVGYGNEARAVIENSRVPFTAEQRFGASAILENQRLLAEFTPPTVAEFNESGGIVTSSKSETLAGSTTVATPTPTPSSASDASTPTPAPKSSKEETDNNATATASQSKSTKVTPASTANVKSAKAELVKDINTNIKNDSETVDSAFSTGERTTGTFNIGRFRAEVSGADSVLPTHSFLVVFAPMLWTRSKFSAQNLDSLLTMRCDNVVLPSVNLLQEQNIRRYGFGPVENVAYGVNVGDFTLQFIVDKEALVVEYFEEWLNLIVNRDSFGGANMNNNINGRKPYEIAYKDTYSCPNVNVFVYDRSQNQVMTYNIYDVFPTGIQSMNMSWSEENTLMKLNITFSFTDLRINRIPPKNNKDDKSFKDQIIVTDTGRNSDGIFAAGGAGSALATLNSSLELTDLTNETTIIGDFPGRIRGSVPPLPPATFQNAVVTDVPIPTSRNTFGTPVTTA